MARVTVGGRTHGSRRDAPATMAHTGPAAPRPWRPTAALALILVVAFMVVLDFSIVNVALASIERELHVGATDVQWVITGYAITFGGLLVLGGRVADLFGRRRMLITGLVLFSLASLWGGLSTSIVELVAARAVQGVGAAVVAPAALSLITTATPEGARRNRALGLYGATASIGFVAGLVLGGVLVQLFDWRSVLWVNVPIGLLAAALAPVLLDESRAAGRVRLDVVGAGLVTGAIAALVYGVSVGPVDGWLAAPTIAALGAAGALGWSFVAWERRHPAPLVRLGILRLHTLRVANSFTVAVGAWSAAELLVLPLYLQLVLHDSPVLTGLAMAPQGVVGFLAAARGPATVRRLGPRRLLVLAASSAGLGLAVLALAVAARSYPLVLLGLLLAGYGTATAMFGSTVAATSGVADHEQGLAGGLVNMSRQVGAAVGVAVAAAIVGAAAAAGASVGADALALGATALAAAVGAAIAHRGLGPVAAGPVAPAPGEAARPAPAPRPRGAAGVACRTCEGA
jgi:EmrB/QacA subfamily drug resistance transporter